MRRDLGRCLRLEVDRRVELTVLASLPRCGIENLFRRKGAIDVCRGCGRVSEGTAAFATSHYDTCRHVQLYSAFVRLFLPNLTDDGWDRIAEIVLLTLGEQAVVPALETVVPTDDGWGDMRTRAAIAAEIVENIVQDVYARFPTITWDSSEAALTWRQIVQTALAHQLPIDCCLFNGKGPT